MKSNWVGLVVGLATSLPAAGQGILNSYDAIEIQAPVAQVWASVKDFDGLHRWHPMFSGLEIKSGGNNAPGTIRTMTVKDGPSFDEELLAFDATERRFRYRLIDPVPLPVADYLGRMHVVDLGRGRSAILWESAYRNNSGGKMKDEEVIGFINGAFRAGLQNLKVTLEASR